MQWTGLNELREKFLQFYETKDHLRLPSFPLVPLSEKSLLLINSGMAPLKKYFMGVETPPSKRVTTCQKCIRTPDIERVGKTSRHGTYFEMLGDFSFGDYFKHEATAWAWEFITKVLEIPEDRLWVSTYTDDQEARDIWTKEVGVSPDRIVILGKADNFWEIGTGPCGPCSEIYFDRGEEHGCGSPDCKVGCDCDRYVEFWNLVFTQFNRDEEGNYTPLAHPNIDTGMGLERLACIMQGVDNLFEVDTVQNIMKHIMQIAGVTYHENEKDDVALRVITDHIRSTTFLVGDGVLPQNEGRGYVLRRLLRRAARYGRLIGIKRPFLYEVCETVIKENASAYPELVEKADYIKKVIRVEEESFSRTIDNGMELLSDMFKEIEEKGADTLSGEQAFKLYDTFGFPIDLTRELVEEKGLKLDEESFNALLLEQKQRSKANIKDKDAAWEVSTVEGIDNITTEFTGYTDYETKGKIVAIVKDGVMVETASEGDQIAIATDKTPFYAESGGQVSDMGVIVSNNAEFKVTDVKKLNNRILMVGEVVKGMFENGEEVVAKLDAERRSSIRRNHTAVHLLQAAAREVLGDHVHQAGSLVEPERLRFDFTHFNAVSAEELKQIEAIVNAKILEGIEVNTVETDLQTAKKQGAMALFSEKYGDKVRMCSVGDFSVELCGGTHIDNTAKIGLFKIISETSAASGVRRIEATTGYGVLNLLAKAESTILNVAQTLKITNLSEIETKAEVIANDLKSMEKEIDRLNRQIAQSQTSNLFANAIDVKGVKLVVASFDGVSPDELRTMGDTVRDKAANAVAVLSSVNGQKGTILTACGADAVELGVHAGKLVNEVSLLTGGRGGGRPDGAMAGVGDVSKIKSALEKASEIVESMIK